MCGIVGGVSLEPISQYIIDGLKSLEYRGYDSAGIALSMDGRIELSRVKGRVDKLAQFLPQNLIATTGVGHTRWATHGEPSEINAHPQPSMHQQFTVVHNGVIDNYRSLKKRLENRGFHFLSETDTEVISNLLEFEYAQTGNVMQSIKNVMRQLVGSYALAILFDSDEEHLYFAKNRSPLVIGKGRDGMYLASDYIPMLAKAKEFVTITDHQYGYITHNDVVIYHDEQNTPLQISFHQTELVSEDIQLVGYPHYMLKEIEESTDVIRRLIDNYFDGNQYIFDALIIEKIKAARNIVFLACGTSYHACLIGRRYFRDQGKNCEVHIASEWAFYPYIADQDSIFIIVSQSGETADLIHCMEIINERGATVITITNTKGSTLDRAADHTLLLFAGIEIAVASTKAYIAQVALFALIAGAIAGTTNTVSDLVQIIKVQKEIIKKRDSLIPHAQFISKNSDVYFLGRGYDYDVARECSLKLKEITYIHSEAFPGGELKHGPIALIEKGTPVIGFVSDPMTADPIRSNFQEVCARGADVLIISSKSLARTGDQIVLPDVQLYLTPLIKVMIGQYLAYFAALELGYNIDKPRNLAKSVTVE
ncbi:MAG: glutamine--fructose-6-phosphate transaminase (isomerizing) [Bacilli bacterium]